MTLPPAVLKVICRHSWLAKVVKHRFPDLVMDDLSTLMHLLTKGLFRRKMTLLGLYNMIRHPQRVWMKRGVKQFVIVGDKGSPAIKDAENARRKAANERKAKQKQEKRVALAKAQLERLHEQADMKTVVAIPQEDQDDIETSDEKEEFDEEEGKPYPDSYDLDLRGNLVDTEQQVDVDTGETKTIVTNMFGLDIQTGRLMATPKLKKKMMRYFFTVLLPLEVAKMPDDGIVWVDWSLDRTESPVCISKKGGYRTPHNSRMVEKCANLWLEADWAMAYWLAILRYQTAVVFSVDGDMLAILVFAALRFAEEVYRGTRPFLPELFLYNKQDAGQPDPLPIPGDQSHPAENTRRVVNVHALASIATKGWKWPKWGLALFKSFHGNDYLFKKHITPRIANETMWKAFTRAFEKYTPAELNDFKTSVMDNPQRFHEFVTRIVPEKQRFVGFRDSVEVCRKVILSSVVGAWYQCSITREPDFTAYPDLWFSKKK